VARDFMKKLAAIFVLAALSISYCVRSEAQSRNASASEDRAARKMEKKQQKAQKKYAKAQRKAQRKMEKYDKKHTHYPNHG
jgi:cell division protein ZapA (FtsZ GTPase activity inhibitor)